MGAKLTKINNSEENSMKTIVLTNLASAFQYYVQKFTTKLNNVAQQERLVEWLDGLAQIEKLKL